MVAVRQPNVTALGATACAGHGLAMQWQRGSTHDMKGPADGMRASGYLACVLGVVMLVACAGQPQFGTFVSASEPALRAVAADVVAGLQTTWPAHRHAMQILEPPEDQFARALAAELRRAGYRVFTEEGQPRAAIGLHFTVDTLGDTRLLRVTLVVQRGRWSRVYASIGGEVRPAGPWAVYTFRTTSRRGG